MNKILSTLSILIYTAYSQSCSNSHDVSTMISFSIHGPSVNGLIGADTFNTIVKDASAAFTQATGQKVGVTAFGGIPPAGATTQTLLGLSTGTGAAVATAIDGMTVDYGSNYGNVAQNAIEIAYNALQNEDNRQKYHVIFSATIPIANGQGSSATPANLDNICDKSDTAKSYGIQTYVVLVGDPAVNAFQSFWSCAVENPATDIIVIDPTAPVYTALTALLCKTDGIDVKITEVNPTDNGNNNAYVEILNRGKTTSVRACLGASGQSGNTGCATAQSITTGDYVAFTSMPTSAPSANTWQARARVSGEDEDTVVYAAGTNYAQYDLGQGRSFELRNIGYNNDNPANFRQACYNVWGTPGAAPAAVCTAVDSSTITGGSCGQTLQEGTCSLSPGCGCESNGATAPDPECLALGAYCNCPNDYLGDVDTCIEMPVPTSCTVNIAPWWDGNDYAFYQWDRPAWDGPVQFQATYKTTDSGGSATTSAVEISGAGVSSYKDVLDNSNSFDLNIITSYTSPIQNKGFSVTVSDIACGSATTLEPTASPTTRPTNTPTMSPSGIPTPSPTFDSPGVYLTTAGIARGDCGGGEARSCCSPFGPNWDATTNTGGSLPSGKTSCDIFNTQIFELTTDDDTTVIKQFEFNLYPEGYSLETNIVARIYAYGLINNTDFLGLNFTGSYKEDGLIPTIFTAANADEWGPTSLTRRRLQNGSSSNIYGNNLNIGVEPLGDSDSWSGTVTIPAGSTSATFDLNISFADLKCNEGDTDCTTYADCTSQSLAFVLVAWNCDTPTSTSGDCKPLYPNTLFFAIRRATTLCAVNFGIGNQEDELPDWFWWVLIALIVFLLILAWLIYRFWWKQKKTAAELGDAEDELDQQIADNEAGFGKELDVGDVAFNPMATGVPGMNRPADAFGNELHQRQLEQQNDMVDVQAEIFQVRQDYGQVNTGNRHHM